MHKDKDKLPFYAGNAAGAQKALRGHLGLYFGSQSVFTSSPTNL